VLCPTKCVVRSYLVQVANNRGERLTRVHSIEGLGSWRSVQTTKWVSPGIREAICPSRHGGPRKCAWAPNEFPDSKGGPAAFFGRNHSMNGHVTIQGLCLRLKRSKLGWCCEPICLNAGCRSTTVNVVSRPTPLFLPGLDSPRPSKLPEAVKGGYETPTGGLSWRARGFLRRECDSLLNGGTIFLLKIPFLLKALRRRS